MASGIARPRRVQTASPLRQRRQRATQRTGTANSAPTDAGAHQGQQLYHKTRSEPTGRGRGWRAALRVLGLRRKQVDFALDTTKAGQLWALVDLVLNALQAALFIYSTTIVDAAGHPRPLPIYHIAAELTLALLILLESGLRHVVVAGDRSSLFALVLFLDTLPPIIASAGALQLDALATSYMAAGAWALLYPIRFYRLLLSFEQAFAPTTVGVLNLGAFHRKLVLLLTAVLCTILFFGASIHALLHWTMWDTMDNEFSFFDAVFFAATCITVGPNDNVVPDNWVTRMMILIIIAVAAVLLPAPISELVSLLEQQTAEINIYKTDQAPSNFILVTGYLEFAAVEAFFKEFFNLDHGYRAQETSVVLLSDAPMAEELDDLLKTPVYAKRVNYVRSSLTQFSTLAKVHAHNAKAIFILGRKFSVPKTLRDDAKVVMATRIIGAYLKTKGAAPLPRLYAQLISPESQFHFQQLGPVTPQTQCIDELRMGVLALNCVVPGFSTMLHLLSTTVTDNTHNTIMELVQRQSLTQKLPWLQDYVYGISQEIYKVRLPHGYTGHTFERVSRSIYSHCGAVLFALGIKLPHRHSHPPPTQHQPSDANGSDPGDNASHRSPPYPHRHHHRRAVVLSPFGYKLHAGDVGFVIAHDQKMVRIIENLNVKRTPPPEIMEIMQQLQQPDGGAHTAITISNIPISLASAHPAHPMPPNQPVGNVIVLGPDSLDATPATETLPLLSDMGAQDHGIMGPGGSYFSQPQVRTQAAATTLAAPGNAHPASLMAKPIQAPFDIGHYFDPIFESPLLQPQDQASSASVDGQGEEDPNESPGLNDEASDHSDRNDENSDYGMWQPSDLPLDDGQVDEFADNPVDDEPSTPHTTAVPATSRMYQQVRRHFDQLHHMPQGLGDAVRDQYANISRARRPIPTNLADHIVLTTCGPEFPRNIEYLIQSIKELHPNVFRVCPAIVVLCPYDPSDLQLLWFSTRSNVYVVKGSPLSYDDLMLINIRSASKAIVLGHGISRSSYQPPLTPSTSMWTSDSGAILGDAAEMVDATSLMAEMTMRQYGGPHLQTATELVYPTNVQLNPDEFLLDVEDQFVQDITRQSFMSGGVVMPSVLDTLLCSSYYNPYRLDLFRQLVFSHEQPISTPESLVSRNDQYDCLDTVANRSAPVGASKPNAVTSGASGAYSRHPDSPEAAGHLDSDSHLCPSPPPPKSHPALLRRFTHLSRASELTESSLTSPSSHSSFSASSDDEDRPALPSAPKRHRMAGDPDPAAVPPADRANQLPLEDLGHQATTAPTLGEEVASGISSTNTTAHHPMASTLERPNATPDLSDSAIHMSDAQHQAHDHNRPGDRSRSRRRRKCTRTPLVLPSGGRVHLIAFEIRVATYGELVHHLAKHHTSLPLGLYRLVQSSGHTYRCVMINPHPSTPMIPSDQIYILSTVNPDEEFGMQSNCAYQTAQDSMHPEMATLATRASGNVGGTTAFGTPVPSYSAPLLPTVIKHALAGNRDSADGQLRGESLLTGSQNMLRRGKAPSSLSVATAPKGIVSPAAISPLNISRASTTQKM
ncbi:hypothetical protein H4R34_003526 [Dimargaris verticillata]|uniref:Calcium-activated potassium channel BK alpha subunit domain-containing protein n=1 Tax=Dimargaris verticillata TaxID=2761393 RepID=A0A9W8ED25_9FUNG|nr:hypothetical protein H4R34_003526 [Dimargaris verticillata]